MGSLEPELFEEIMTNIQYNADFYEKAARAIESAGVAPSAAEPSTTINVIHMRLEGDVLFFAEQLNYSLDEYRKKLSELYIENIKKHIDKNSTNLILCYDPNNEVIDFMRDNGYNYTYLEKHDTCNEKNAVVDFIAAQLCNGVFIGNYNLEKKRGSTYSYYVMRMMEKYSPAVKNILLYLNEAAAAAAEK